MLNDELVKYVTEAKKAGTGDEQIKQALLSAGWQNQDIDEALKLNNAANLPSENQAVSRQTVKPKSKFSKILIISLVGVSVLGGTYFVLAKYILHKTAPNNPESAVSPSPTPAPQPATAGQSVLAKTTVKKLGTYPDSGGCTFSPDFLHTACAELQSNPYLARYVVDGHPGNQYKMYDSGTFSPDGKHFVYSAEKDGGGVVVFDGTEGKLYRGDGAGLFYAIGSHSYKFSPDSSKLAYKAYKDKDQVVVINGVEGKHYNEIWGDIGNIIFSSDSKNVAYIARQLKNWYVVVNGKEGEANYWIPESLTFSPDSNHLAYIGKVENGVSTGQGKNFKYVFVLDDKKGPAYDVVRNILFSADSSQYAYVAENSGRVFVVLNGKELTPDLGGNHGYISQAFSPDGKQFAYVSEKGGKYFAVLDGKEGQPYDLVNNLMFSPDGKKFAYIAIKDKKSFFVVNGSEGKAYDGINSPAFSPDGNHLAYIAQLNTKQSVEMDPQKIALYKMAYPGKELPKEMDVPKFLVVVDDKEGKQYEFLGNIGYSILPIQFSPDSREIVYVAYAAKKSFVVINDKEGEGYDYIETYFSQDDNTYTTFRFNQTSNTVTYVAKQRIQGKDVLSQQEDLYQVEQPLQ